LTAYELCANKSASGGIRIKLVKKRVGNGATGDRQYRNSGTLLYLETDISICDVRVHELKN